MSENIDDKPFDVSAIAKGMDDDAFGELKRLQQLLEFDASMRGSFLVQAITIEGIIDRIFSHHFAAKEDQNLFMALLMKQLQFSKKIHILDKLLTLRYPKLKEKYVGLHKELQEVSEFRNKLAHSEPHDVDGIIQANVSDTIRLAYYEGEDKKSLELKRSDIEKRIVKCQEILGKLLRIDTEIDSAEERYFQASIRRLLDKSNNG